MKSKPLALFIALLAALSLLAAACGGSDADDASSDDTASSSTSEDSSSGSGDDDAMEDDEPAAPAGPLKVAVVAPSASNDLAFSQSMVDAVNAVAGDRELEIAVTDGTFIVEDAAAAMRGYAEDGFDLVIAHGSQYGGPLQEIAPDFPDTAFAWGTAVDTFGIENVSAYTVRSDEGGYVNGVMAAQLSESGVLGVVGPIEVGDAKLYVDGFAAGAVATDPNVTVNINYIESFSDVALAAEAAQAHIQNGADVLTGTAQMVVGATGVAGPAGAQWFGTQSNQTPLGPDFVVASQVYHWEVVLAEMMAEIDAGNFGGDVYTLTLENGGLEIEFNDDIDLPADVRASADATIAGLMAGSITTDGSAPTESAAAPAGMLKVAVVAPSASNDLAFTQSMVDAVNAVAGDRELEIAVTDGTFIVEDAAAAIRGYAEDGFDLVIAHGSQYGGPLQEIAPEFPDTAFAWGTAVDTFGIPNVSAYTVRSDQGGYINGYLAAEVSESGIIGVVGPIEVGDAKLYVDGFVEGATRDFSGTTVNVNYIESFSDVALAAEAAQAHIQNGADVLSGTAQMVVGATGIAGPAGAKWFGTQSNQTALGPDFVVASQVYHWEVLLAEMMAAIDAGNFGGEVYTATLENGGLVIELNDAVASADAQATVDELVAGIIDGSIKTEAG